MFVISFVPPSIFLLLINLKPDRYGVLLMKKQYKRLKRLLLRRKATQGPSNQNISMLLSVMFAPKMDLPSLCKSSTQKVRYPKATGSRHLIPILTLEGIASLEKMMAEFSVHHRSAVASPPGFVPKGGDLVSAKFSDGAWYRAKIRRASPIKREAEVTFIDYGNQDIVSFSNIRPLDPKFRSLPGQAHDARLRLVLESC